jgi:hypothetical protein
MSKVNKQVQKQVQFHMKLNGLMNECMNYVNNNVPLSTPFLTAHENAIGYVTKTQEIVYFSSVNKFMADDHAKIPQALKDKIMEEVILNAQRLNCSVESIKSQPVIMGADSKNRVQGTLLQCETMIRTGDNQYVYGGFMGRVSH